MLQLALFTKQASSFRLKVLLKRLFKKPLPTLYQEKKYNFNVETKRTLKETVL